MAIETKKMSEFADGGDLEPNQDTIGLEGGANVRFNNPFPLLEPGTTAERPAAAASMYYRLRFNTTLESYEYYSPTAVDWVQLEDSTDIATLLALLASHLTGEGASLVGLENQTGVLNKTLQDLANADIIAQTDNGTLTNAQILAALANGFVSVANTTGVLSSRTLTGTANEIDVTNGDGAGDPKFSLSPTMDAPGTFTVQSSVPIDSIIDDDTFATATATNVPTSESVKAYADSIASGFVWVAAVRVASTANFVSTYDNGTAGVGATLTATANGAASIDGVSLSLNDRVLHKDQTNTFENGIYYVSQVGDGSNPAIYTRTTDFDQASEINPNDLVPVGEGSVNAETMWRQTQDVTTIGTDAILFTLFGINPSDIMTLSTAQTATGSKTFDLFSGTMDGDVDADSNTIINLTDPSSAQDAATKNYVDGQNHAAVQFVRASTTTGATTTTTIPADNTIPQNTEGSEFITLAITPTNASNLLEIEIFLPFVDLSVGSAFFIGALFQDSTADALAAGLTSVVTTSFGQQFLLKYTMAAGTTSSTTFKFRYGPTSGSAYVMQLGGANYFSTASVATMTIKEWAV